MMEDEGLEDFFDEFVKRVCRQSSNILGFLYIDFYDLTEHCLLFLFN